MPVVNSANAQTIALKALAFIASDEQLLGAFMAACGCSPSEIKDSALDPAFLGGVLDFVLQDDKGVLDFCETAGIEPDLVRQARHALPGSPGFDT
jgi:hypothetical protein